ncbi:claudin-16-like [Callorhinchus milii]|uniref:claudin-16-like n=1 Tax=Callorhinchus milii TaxID=7868 RepID=UPI001C3F7371|nr:claudin-16-like [Callorhinchus milii]
MGTTFVQVFALFLGLSATVLLILADVTDCWRKDAKDAFSSVGLSYRCRGLWSECVYDITADYWTCDIHTSFLGHLPSDLVITRALVIVANGACVAAALILVCGMKCTRIVGDSGAEKSRLTLCAGAMALIGGMSGGIGVSWYAVETVIKYRFEVGFRIPGITYELAVSFWLAGAGVLCLWLCGTLLATTLCVGLGARGTGIKGSLLAPRDPAMGRLPTPGLTDGKTYV